MANRRSGADLRAAVQAACLADLTEQLPELVKAITDQRVRIAGLTSGIEAIDQTIAELRGQRVALVSQLRQAEKALWQARCKTYKDVVAFCRSIGLSAEQMLRLAVDLQLDGNDEKEQIFGAAANLLRVSCGEPLLVYGHAFLAKHGLWYGGVVNGSPTIKLDVTGWNFCIGIPVVANNKVEICMVPIASLQEGPDGAEDKSQVYIGQEAIWAIVQQELSGGGALAKLHIQAALADAGMQFEE